MILDQKVSYFRKTRDTEVGGEWTICEALEAIQQEKYGDIISKIRKNAGLIGDELKKDLPTVAVHGLFEFNRKKSDFIQASGIIIMDIDDIDKEDNLEEIKRDIMESSDHVLAVMISPSGNGIKSFVLC